MRAPVDLRLDSLRPDARDSNDFLTPMPGEFTDNVLYITHNLDVKDKRSRILGSLAATLCPARSLEANDTDFLEVFDEDEHEPVQPAYAKFFCAHVERAIRPITRTSGPDRSRLDS